MPLIYVPELQQVQYILAGLVQERHMVTRRLECSSLELVKNLVLDGVGIGVLPYRVATHGVAAGRLELVSALLPHFDDTIALLRRYDVHQTNALRLLLDGLHQHGQNMSEIPARIGDASDRRASHSQ